MVYYNYARRKAFLRKMGLGRFTVKEGTRRFQAAYNLGTWLKVDGDFGPLTTAAAERTVRYGYRVSPHFHWTEFQCPCMGTMGGCWNWHVDRRVLTGLEALRARAYQGGLTIVSGYRCKVVNRNVGGQRDSLHLRGLACDIPARVKPRNWPRGVSYLNENGYQSTHGMITHVGYQARFGGRTVFFME